MKRSKPAVVFAILFFAASGFISAQAVEKARVLYSQGAVMEAYDLLSSEVPETSSDAQLKYSASALLSDMGIAEYNASNFKNAYMFLKKALKLNAANSAATQYYTKMRKEMNVNTLENKSVAVKNTTADAVSTAALDVQSRNSAEIQSETAIKAPNVLSEEVNALIAKLSEAEIRLNAAEAVVTRLSASETAAKVSKTEDTALKYQLDEQRKLNQQTLQLLSKIVENQSNQSPQVILQSDPSLQALTSLVSDQKQLLESKNWMNMVVTLSLVCALVLLVSITVVFILLSIRSRKRRAAAQQQGAETFENQVSIANQSIAITSPQRTLIGYINSESSDLTTIGEQDLRKQLLRADRLNRMYEDAKSGMLTVDTVRKYSDELSTALKAEILKLIETKLTEGDLISNEAVLPVIFPFLTDYDDYIRSRAEKAAAVALLENKPGASANQEDGVFGVKELMQIPEKLKTVLKGRDQSIVTAKLSRSIAKQLGFSIADCHSIYRAALAHDAGYLMLDGDRLQQVISKADITEEEYDFIKGHTVKGPLYFGEIEIPQEIRDALLHHHERNDGSGYPNGLKKDEIPIFARVIAVAESFAAMISNRPDRGKMESGHALAIIRDSKFKFDRDAVEALSTVVKSNGGYK